MTLEATLTDEVRTVGSQLQCDRCFLYLRFPETGMGRVPFCWRRDDSIPLIYDANWKPEPSSLPEEDPMFAAALQTKPAIFVEDVETAPANVLNRAFERENFGHRALVHAHLVQEQQLWGVLQPCVFGRPRPWSQGDRTFIQQAVERITPLAVAYVKQHQSDREPLE